MRDDLHVGLALPRRLKRIVRAMTNVDWRGSAAEEAREALAKELMDGVRPNIIKEVQNVLSRMGSDLFTAQSGGDPTAMQALRGDRRLGPLETRFLDHVESRLSNLNSLNVGEIVTQSLDSLARERLEGISGAILQEVARKSLEKTPEARRRLGQINAKVDTGAISRDLARSQLRVEARSGPKPLDMDEDLRPEASK